MPLVRSRTGVDILASIGKMAQGALWAGVATVETCGLTRARTVWIHSRQFGCQTCVIDRGTCGFIGWQSSSESARAARAQARAAMGRLTSGGTRDDTGGAAAGEARTLFMAATHGVSRSGKREIFWGEHRSKARPGSGFGRAGCPGRWPRSRGRRPLRASLVPARGCGSFDGRRSWRRLTPGAFRLRGRPAPRILWLERGREENDVMDDACEYSLGRCRGADSPCPPCRPPGSVS